MQPLPLIKETALCIRHRALLITIINQNTELWIPVPDTSIIHLPHQRLREIGARSGGGGERGPESLL